MLELIFFGFLILVCFGNKKYGPPKYTIIGGNNTWTRKVRVGGKKGTYLIT